MTPSTPHGKTDPRAADRCPAIDPKRCTGCGRCVAVCPPHVLSLHTVRWDKHAVLDDADGCTACAACAVVCPFHAVTMRRTAQGHGDHCTQDDRPSAT